MNRPAHRHGFTLIEMLVATGVFVIGFVAVFGLFLAGVRFRKLSDDTVRCSLAASSLVNEIRIDAGKEGGVAHAPADYVGDGFALVAEPWTGNMSDQLFPYPGQPGIWYRVIACDEVAGTVTANPELTTALRMKLLVLTWASAESGNILTFQIINDRLRLNLANADEVCKQLVERAIAIQCQAVITRGPSWLN
jgi:prepilin-type N-terminal cleavage/methylation domain-containing protein